MEKIDLRENTKVEETKDEYSVATLKQKFAEQESVVAVQEGELSARMRSAQNIVAYLHEQEEALKEFKGDERERAQLEKGIADDREIFKGEREAWDKERRQTHELDAETKFAQSWLNQDAYAQSFAQLYRIKDLAKIYGEDADVKFDVINSSPTSGMMTYEQHLVQCINELGEDDRIPHLSLQVDLHNGLPFNVVVDPYDGNAARVKMKIAFDEEELNNIDFSDEAKAKENKEKIKQIFEFCEKFGFSTEDFDVPYTFDGHVDSNQAFANVKSKIGEGKIADDPEQIAQKVQLSMLFDEVKGDIVAAKSQALEDELKEVEVGRERRKEIFEEISKDHPEIKSEDDISEDKAPKEDDFIINDEPVIEEQAKDSITPLNETAKENTEDQNGMHMPAFLRKHRKQNAPVPPAQAAASAKQTTLAEAEKAIETMLEDNLAKRKDVSYRKKWLFHPSWTEYVVYDQDYAYKEDGTRDPKTGKAKFTYAYKLFVKQGPDGRMSFTYRTPNNKKMDEQAIDALVGAFKDMGYTHINFPNGIPDAEKGIWRKMLAEKGIVPRGMSLDRSKVEGMLEAAKKKLSSEKLAEYKYRLALEMNANNRRKRKKVEDSEQEFIDGLIASYRYRAFTNGYAMGMKGVMTRVLRAENQDTGAIEKIAAFRAMRRVFDVYKEALGLGDITSSNILTRQEKDLMAHPERFVDSEGKRPLAGLGPIVGSPENLTPEQMAGLLTILMERSKAEVKDKFYKELIEVRENKNIGAKRADKIIIGDMYKAARNQCNSINEDLQAAGVDEIGLPKSFDVPMEYDQFKRDYEERVRNNQTNSSSNTAQNTGNTNQGNIDADTNSGGMGSRAPRSTGREGY